MKKYWELAELENEVFFAAAILNFLSRPFWIFFLLHLCEKSSPFIWGIIFFCTMDGFFRILKKTSFQLFCTRLYFYLNHTLHIVRASNWLVKMVIIYVLQVLLDYSKPWHHGREIISKVAIICCSRFSWEVFSISGQVIVEQIFCKYLVKTLGFRAISKWVSNVCVCICRG